MGQALVVGDQHQGRAALFVEFEQQVADALASVAVEVAGGFIGKQHVRLRGKGAGNGYPLLLATGELAWRVSQALAQADTFQQVPGAFAGVFAAVQLQRQHDVFQRVEAVEQLERLKYEANVLGTDTCALVFVEGAEGLPGEGDFAAAGQVEAGQQTEEGGFAGTGTADDCQAIALVQFQAQFVQDSQFTFRGTVLIVGDSISAGFGLDTSKGWVALLQQRLKQEGFDDKVVNASISGDTSAGGLARLPAALAEHKPDVVVIELGGNDGLRGQPPAQLQQNLASMIDQSKAGGAKVLLLGMQLPPNYGPRYTTAFAEVYGVLAKQKNVPLVPFFLDGVGGHPELMQADQLHPAVGAQGKLLENVWPTLKPLL